MYPKQEAARLKHEFWTAFGIYMQPVPGAEGEKVNWVNYKTGVKNLFFRMSADTKRAVISIEVTHKEDETREWYFNKFLQVKRIFEETVPGEWIWQKVAIDDHGQKVSRIYTELKGVNFFQKDQWPAFISFFKPRLTALDEFWSTVKYGFEGLGS